MNSRIPTGIKGFDELVKGGLPRGSNILLSGSPASGKTIFGLQFLYNGAKFYSEPGLYISYEESKDALLKTCRQFNWEIDELVSKKKLRIKSFQKEPAVVDTLLADIKKQVASYGIKRLVIDSLTTLNLRRVSEEKAGFFDAERQKNLIFELIEKLSKINDVTKILISEVEGEDRLASEEVSPFLCEGIIFIRYSTRSDRFSREIIVRKMRFTNHISGFHPLEINENGILVRNLQ